MKTENGDGIDPNKKADFGFSELTEESTLKEVLLLTRILPSLFELIHSHPSRFDSEVSLLNE